MKKTNNNLLYYVLPHKVSYIFKFPCSFVTSVI